MDFTHDETIELLGVYALDAVDDDEKVAVEAHLAECPRCAAEVADHREVAAAMAFSGAPAPEGLWSRIVETLEEAPPELNLPLSAPVASLDSARAARAERSGWRTMLQPLPAVAAAVMLAIGLLAGVLITAGDDGPNETELLAQASLEDVARRVLNDAKASKIVLESPSGELTATAAVDSDGSGYLLGTSLPALDPSQTYQLWGIAADTVISLGVLGESPGVVAFHLDKGVETLAITSEIAGGVPVSANAPLLVGNLS